MLRALLLLCLAATIVSAGDSKNVNNTSVPVNSVGDNVATNSQLPLGTVKPLTDKDVISVPSESTARTFSDENVPSNDSTTVSSKRKTTTTTTTSTTTTTTTTTTSKPDTTTAPSTTTSAPISTTLLPPPSSGTWKVEKNNTYCILVQLAAQFNVSYINADNVTIHKAIDIPSNSNSTGSCGKVEQTLSLLWNNSVPQNNSVPMAQNNFTLHFVKNETDKHYSLHHLEISLVPEKSDKSNKTVTLVHLSPQFNTELSNSYRCLKEQSLNLTLEGNKTVVGQLKVSNLQFQAFRNDNTTVFGLAKDCSFDTPDIVPITVGCALAGLVVVVLIAYLVGRRRSQSRGYLSM